MTTSGGRSAPTSATRSLPPAGNSVARSERRQVLDRDHRPDRPALDLLRRLLDAIHALVFAVVDVDDPLRDQLCSGLAARDELGKAVRREAGGNEAALELEGVVAESVSRKAERDHVVVV